MKLKNNIREKMIEKGMTVAELSEALGIHEQCLWKYRRQQHNPLVKDWEKIADILGCNERELFYLE